MTPAERALLRIREEITERRLSQRDLAEVLHCSQGRVAKILNGGVNLRVNDLAALAEAAGITLVEACRDRGLEFYAELTPSEVRVLERLRRRPLEVLHAIGTLLGVEIDLQKPNTPARKRDAPRKRGRPLRSKQGPQSSA